MSAMLMLFLVTQEGFHLSGAQIVERDLGASSSRLDLGGRIDVAPGQTRRLDDVRRALRQAGARRPVALLESLDEVFPAVVDAPITVFVEGPWASEPFPDRYALRSGRWPAAAGEVVVSAAVSDATGPRRALPVLSGNATLRVVGHVHDRFATDSARILAAPGTWDGFASRRLSEKYPELMASPAILWRGGDADRAMRALASVIAPRKGAGEATALTEALRTELRTRGAELAGERRSWIDRLPLAYRFPSLLLPILAAFAAFGLNNRRLGRNLGILRAVGISARDASAAVLLAGAAWSVAAACAGSAIGTLLGIVGRPLAQAALSRPLGPVPSVSGPILKIVGLVALACLAVALHTVVVQRRSSTRSLLSAVPRPRSASHARHALAALAAAAAIWQVVGLDSVEKTMILVGTLTALVTLITPEIVAFVVRRLPTTGPRRRLAGRQLQFDPRRSLIAVALLTACLGPAFGMVTLLDTLITSDAKAEVSDVAPGQVLISSPYADPRGPPADLVRRVVDRLEPKDPPIQVDELGTDDVSVDLDGEEFGLILSVKSASDAARLSNNGLTTDQRATLARGGLLVWAGQGDETRRLEAQDSASGTRRRTVPIKTTAGAFEPSWEERAEGIVLNSTADRLKLPRSHADRVLTGLDARAAAGAERVALDAGYDSAHIAGYRAPEPAEVPPAFSAAVLGLGLLAMATVYAVALAQASSLRGYLGALVAIGLSRRWARDVLNLETALLVGLSCALAIAIALPPIVAAGLRVPLITLSVPWLTLAAIVICFFAAATLATALCSRNLRASDRL
ncbi:MAG: hypothetical protein M3401_19375 [Actinomycetota bacterium]|nr:hypothetical protein [Actinomycetota bacterium]